MAGNSVHYDCAVAVRTKLLTKTFTDLANSWQLPGSALPPSRISIGILPRIHEEFTPLPHILIATIGAELEMGTLLNTDDIGYPVVVAIVAAGNADFTTNMETYLAWRQTIYRAFRNQRLNVPGFPSVFLTRTYPDVVFDPEAFNNNYVYSGVLFRFISRETRG